DNGISNFYSINAQAPSGMFTDGQSQDLDALNEMLRDLLTDRFKMSIHYEDRSMDAQTLVAVNPKLTKANPLNRTGCTPQDTVLSNSDVVTHLTCRNMTMTQF